MRRQLAQHAAGKRLVRLASLLHHRTLGRRQRHQRVPVVDQDVGAIDLLAQRLGRTQRKLVIDVARLARIEHAQAFLHRQSRRDDENRPRKILALRIGQRIRRLPDDDHAHHQRLAGAGGHLAAHALPWPAVARQIDALAKLRRTLHPPDQRLDRLDLAEVEGMHARRGVAPVLQQPARNGRRTRIAGRAPGVDPAANLIDARKLLAAPGVVADVEDFVAGRPAAGGFDQRPSPVRPPMAGRCGIRGVEDQGSSHFGICFKRLRQ